MNKYEIMILINGTLTEKDADLVNLDLQKKLKETKNFSEKKMERAKLKRKKFLEKQKKLEAALANKKIENQQNNEMGGEKQ